MVLRYRIIWVILLVALAGPLLAAGKQSPSVVKLGVVGPLSGPASDYGIKQLRGVTLAVEEINSSGYLPFSLEVVPADDKGNSSLVGEIARDLVFKDGVTAFIGCVNSACTHVLEMICVKVQKPQITTVSTDPSITRAGTPWIFRCLADDRRQARAIVNHVQSDASLSERIAVLTLDDRYGKMGAKTCTRYLKENGANVVFEETFPKGEADRATLVTRVMNARPSVIVLWSLYTEAAQVIRALRMQGSETVVIAPDGVTTSAFVERAGSYSEGMIVTLPFNRFRNSEKTRTFLNRYRERWNQEADSFSAHAYDGAYIMALAMKKGGADPFGIRDALLTTSGFNGVTGVISFDSSGNDTRDVELAVIKDGDFLPLHLAGKTRKIGY